MALTSGRRTDGPRVNLWVLLSSIALAVLVAVQAARAHEVQPAVADLTIAGNDAEIAIDMTLEAPLAGVDLDGLEDTNAAENADAYDARRRLTPEALAAELAANWPRLAAQLTLRAGDTALAPELRGQTIPEVGNPETPRISRIVIGAALPDDGSPVVFGWDASLGGLVLRQQGVEDGYTAYLTGGALSDPIARTGPADETALSAFLSYIAVGFDHIVPRGLDHILFVLGLFFLALRLRPLLWQVSAFTLAHTVTLALGALEILRIPAAIVEPLIAVSIVYVGVENVLSKGLTPWRPLVVFCFGLLHGLGFAAVLTDFGLGASHFVPKLIGFNLGVELGQLAVIAAAFLLVGAWFGKRDWYRTRIANPASVAIALVGAWWVVQRTLL